MPIVMEGNSITIIAVYSGCSNYRATKITPNVFDDCFGIRKIRFGIDIEALFMVVVTIGLDFFKRLSLKNIREMTLLTA